MSFFDTILINTICILFPLLIYIVFIAHKNNNHLKYEECFFELVLLTSLFLIVKLTGNKYNNYSIVLINIPLLFSYIKGKKFFSGLLSSILIFYFYKILNYNIFIIIIEYIAYYVLYIINKKKIINNSRYTIMFFSLIKSFFFSFYMFYTSDYNKFIAIFNSIFISMTAFYVCSNMYYFLLQKAEDTIDLNNSLKELQKEKTLRNSLFKLTHEIKNPIAVCKGYLDMIDLKNYESSKKYINIITNEINRTLVIMDDFLDVTKVKVTKNIMDINYLLEDTINSMNSLFKNKSVTTIYKIDDEEVFINGDYNRLKQVLVNILKNCVESKVEGKKLTISIKTKIDINYYIISIKDNSICMD